MLGPVLGKAARRKRVPRLPYALSNPPPSSIRSCLPPAAFEQCRKSSSKPSGPPSGDSPPVPADAPPSRKRTFSKMSRTKAKEESTKIVSSPPNFQAYSLPSVPSTQHLQRQDVHIASFFAFHRPISVNTTIPIAKTEKDFSKIFVPRSAKSSKATQVILTLTSAVENLDKATHKAEQLHQSQSQLSPSEQDLHTVVTQALQSNTESSASQNQPALFVNIEELAAKFRPFRPPPPPVPMEDSNEQHPIQPAQATPARQLDLPAAVVEEISEGILEQNAPQTDPRHPFLNRLYIKHLRREEYLEKRRQEVYHAISVKRQRRLKMKKHKYKKLMKRTRNLRRRQDRL